MYRIFTWKLFLIVNIIVAKAIDVAVITDPIIFSQTVEIMCKVDMEPLVNMTILSWYYKKNSQITELCKNEKCHRNGKYDIKEEYNAFYNLSVHNFSVSDVNIEYGCRAEIINDTVHASDETYFLHLDDKKFVYIPKDEDITTYVGRNNAKLDISIVFQMVFPVAVCEIEYSKRNLTDHVLTTIWQNELFYSEYLRLHRVPIDNTNATVSITCHFGSTEKIVLQKTLLTDSTEPSSSKQDLTIPFLAITTALTFLITWMVLYILMKAKSAKDKDVTQTGKDKRQLKKRHISNKIFYISMSELTDRELESEQFI